MDKHILRKRKICFCMLILCFLLAAAFTGCGYREYVDTLDQYRAQVETFSSTFSSLTAGLSEIDPADEASGDQFKDLLYNMSECLTAMAAVPAPESYAESAALCGQAADAMRLAADTWDKALQNPGEEEEAFAQAEASYQQACLLISQMTSSLPQ